MIEPQKLTNIIHGRYIFLIILSSAFQEPPLLIFSFVGLRAWTL